MNSKSVPVTGAQSVHRALHVLKLVSDEHEHGITLGELEERSLLNRTTTYRLVQTLVSEGYVQRDPLSKKYHLGITAMQVGLTAMSRAPIIEPCIPIMREIADATDSAVFLTVRNGDYAQCLHSEQCSPPLRVLHMLVGNLRLLGLGTAGQALLATLEDDEVESLYRRHQSTYERNSLSPSALQRVVSYARTQGYTMAEGLVVNDVSAVAVPFEGAAGQFAALSVASVASKMKAPRRAALAEYLMTSVGRLRSSF